MITSVNADLLEIPDETNVPSAENIPPMVSICTAAYNHEQYVGKAIESVLAQEVNFPIEMVIGEDNSKDGTRAVCEKYVSEFPDKLKLLPLRENLGMSRNGMRIVESCRGKYIAILDGDDYWIDPTKLQRQVDFLESNPEYGLVYSDIQPVDMDGNEIESETVKHRRHEYAEGQVFPLLLQGTNFVNACTALFRREALDLVSDPVNTYWYSFDFWKWMRIAVRYKVGFIGQKTACYRIHDRGITNTTQYSHDTKKRMYYVLYDVLEHYHRHRKFPLPEAEQMAVFRKMMSLLYRNDGTLAMKWKILKRVPKYFPGFRVLARIISLKLQGMSSQVG